MATNRRAIAEIATDLAVALKREASDIIAIGTLLLEAKEAVDYGDWRAWLATNFGSSSKTADNYMNAASFAVTCETVSQLKLRPTALYLLGGNDPLFSPEAIEAILKVAETEWVNAGRAREIAQSLLSPPEIAIVAEPPPPSSLPSPRGEGQFDRAMEMLVQVYTKPLSNFVGTKHSTDRIISIIAFLEAIIAKRKDNDLASTRPMSVTPMAAGGPPS